MELRHQQPTFDFDTWRNYLMVNVPFDYLNTTVWLHFPAIAIFSPFQDTSGAALLAVIESKTSPFTLKKKKLGSRPRVIKWE